MRSKQRFKSDRHDLSIVKFIKLHLCGDDKRIYSFNCVKTSRYGNSEKLIKKKAKSHQKKKKKPYWKSMKYIINFSYNHKNRNFGWISSENNKIQNLKLPNILDIYTEF